MKLTPKTIWWILVCLVAIILFFVIRTQTINKDHRLCSDQVDDRIADILSYQESMGDTQVWEIGIPGVKLWNLKDLKLSELEVSHTSTDFKKNHYGFFNRYYDLSVAFSVHWFEFNVPVTCDVKWWEVELKLWEKSK
jgi:hypothetical protein